MTSALLNIKKPTPELMKHLEEVLNKTGHHAVGVTNILERDNKILGYLSIAGLPTVHFHLCPEVATIHDVLSAMSYWEGSFRHNGITQYWLPCESDSRLFPFVERADFLKTKFDTVWAKKLI